MLKKKKGLQAINNVYLTTVPRIIHIHVSDAKSKKITNFISRENFFKNLLKYLH